MKIRNLLLASLAIVAMTACSNDNEVVDNGNQILTGENAGMSLRFAFSDRTRAVEPGNPSESAGEEFEWSTTSVTVVLDYGPGIKPIIVENLGTITTEGSVKVAETQKFEVKSGKANIYAFINPGSVNFNNQLSTLTVGEQALPATGLDYLSSGIAKSNYFMMSNTNGQPVTVDIIAGKDDNTATISVERVSAKLEEITPADAEFALTAQTANGPAATIKMLRHTYINLAKNSYILSQPTSWTANNANAYLHPYVTANPNYRWLTGNKVTYCLENIIAGAWNIAQHTSVLYEGQVYFENENAPSPTFYVKNNPTTNVDEIFRSWAALCAAYGGLDPNGEATTDLAKYNILKYTDGKCYYYAPIEDVNVGISVVRNNWYKLNVSTIKDLGYPTELPPYIPDTKLTVKVKIEPWSIHLNNVEL